MILNRQDESVMPGTIVQWLPPDDVNHLAFPVPRSRQGSAWNKPSFGIASIWPSYIPFWTVPPKTYLFSRRSRRHTWHRNDAMRCEGMPCISSLGVIRPTTNPSFRSNFLGRMRLLILQGNSVSALIVKAHAGIPIDFFDSELVKTAGVT